MTTFLTLLVVAVFGYLIYHYLPSGTERAFRLERFRPRGPMSDWTASYYDEQRRHSDLSAIYGRGDLPEPKLPVAKEISHIEQEAVPAEQSEQPKLTPLVRQPQLARRPGETEVAQYAWRSRRTVAHSAGETRRPEKGVRRLVTDPSTLDSKAS
ncbi:hypothetical protein OG203_27585 [Nocardia sp. NBC_01499]|uniref:hypothetical protein n=1 Tax=Nocardia sp. NBC_01499 TaxID=2903597 RepID=UPI00386D6B2D